MKRPILVNIQPLKTFHTPFDDEWSNKYSIKCGRFCTRFSSETSGTEYGYGRVYDLCEFLWKLGVWKP